LPPAFLAAPAKNAAPPTKKRARRRRAVREFLRFRPGEAVGAKVGRAVAKPWPSPSDFFGKS